MTSSPMRPKKIAIPDGLIDVIGEAFGEFRRKRVTIHPDATPVVAKAAHKQKSS